MKTASLFLLAMVFGFCLPVSGQRNAAADIKKLSTVELFKNLAVKDWMGRVAPAKKELESRHTEIFVGLEKILDKDEKVKLENTADLIYPGAETFFGHGWVLDYDVDWVSVRAGWLLEDLTFEDFGFREGVIDHDAILMTVIKGKSDSYIADLKSRLKNQDAKKQARTLAAEKAKDWIKSHSTGWNRFDAVLQGLKGEDSKKQHRIFQWLRNGDTTCAGLTTNSFEKFLLPEVMRLAKSPQESIREEVQYLIEDHSKGKWWYRRKLERDYPNTYTTMDLK